MKRQACEVCVPVSDYSFISKIVLFALVVEECVIPQHFDKKQDEIKLVIKY